MKEPFMEPFMEPILRKMRISKVLDEIKHVPGCTLLDIGCGFNYMFLSTVAPFIQHGTGVDFKVPEVELENITTIQITLADSLPFPDNKFDLVTMLAVLEHMDQPVAICAEAARVLKPGGKLVLTVPGKRAKPVLEFLSYRLGIINRAEIEDHKKYYDLPELKILVAEIDNLRIIKHRSFQLGMNNFCVIQKQEEGS